MTAKLKLERHRAGNTYFRKFYASSPHSQLDSSQVALSILRPGKTIFNQQQQIIGGSHAFTMDRI